MRKFGSSFSVRLLSLATTALIIAAACGGGEPEDVEVSVTIREDRMSPDTIQVNHNDSVTLKIDSDMPGAFHLHGYDIEREVVPGEVTDFAFAAEATGRYRIAFHKAETGGGLGHGHGESAGGDGHGPMSQDPIESEVPVSVEISAAVEPNGGVNVFITTKNWRWAPDEVDQGHVPGAGHAHIYVDGEKIDRVYGPEYHLTGLSPGSHEVRVTLNANSHNELLVDGELVEDTVSVTVEESSHAGGHGGGPDEADTSSTPVETEIDIGFLEVHPR